VINNAGVQGHLNLPIPLQHSQDFPILQYADHTLVIMEACPSQVLTLKYLLQVFSASTGLKVNYSKSMLVPINLVEDRTAQLAQIFGCLTGSLPLPTLACLWA
jgi:hypothetical protein